MDFKKHVVISSEAFLLFFVITIPLTILTFAGWWYWHTKEMKRHSKKNIHRDRELEVIEKETQEPIPIPLHGLTGGWSKNDYAV